VAGSDVLIDVIGGVQFIMRALPHDLWHSADRQCWLSVADGCFSASAPLEDVPIMPCASLSLRAAMQRRPCSDPVQHLPKPCPKPCASSRCLAADPVRAPCLVASQRARPGRAGISWNRLSRCTTLCTRCGLTGWAASRPTQASRTL